MWGAGHRPLAGKRIAAAPLLAILLSAFQVDAAWAQEPARNSFSDFSSRDISRAADGIGPAANDDGQAASPSQQLLRVPRPSSHGSQLGSMVGSSDRENRRPGSSGWWLGSAGITLVLAVCGAICIAARKYWPQEPTGSLRVVGRLNLSSRHSIYLVRAGERVLLIGAGSQGAPSLLGELTEEIATTRATPGLEIRLGDEE